MSNLDPLLTCAVDYHGKPMFYPPGAHPALNKHRKMLAQLQSFPPSPHRDQHIAYTENQIISFEEDHSIQKYLYLKRVSGE